jgi:hypothetical protein
MLQRGDQIPHIDVRDLNDALVRYASIWQHRNLVLIVLPEADSPSIGRYLEDLSGVAASFGDGTSCVTTRTAIAGLPAPAVAVADKWGEIMFVCATADVADLPPPRELADWVTYVDQRCPECEGEAK